MRAHVAAAGFALITWCKCMDRVVGGGGGGGGSDVLSTPRVEIIIATVEPFGRHKCKPVSGSRSKSLVPPGRNPRTTSLPF